MGKQLAVRKGHFDAMHRVMDHYSKCRNIHGHSYLYELGIGFNQTEAIGYAIDFGEIKRVGEAFLQDMMDHGALLNPKDEVLINVCNQEGYKYWTMSINGEGEHCNPSAENIAKEIFLACEILFSEHPGIWMEQIVLFETPKSSTITTKESIDEIERENFRKCRYDMIMAYAKEKGVKSYRQ
ncbi:6-carboxytetrahydropterin synthase [Algivirga pacifica]|uniref:6-carboxy-5,6,7,8-tetrahydropterin synthase n=1 Tax=Algivirga pacifica TaxID=1162670 RepID=A0ABP9DLX1_9BACT